MKLQFVFWMCVYHMDKHLATFAKYSVQASEMFVPSEIQTSFLKVILLFEQLPLSGKEGLVCCHNV